MVSDSAFGVSDAMGVSENLFSHARISKGGQAVVEYYLCVIPPDESVFIYENTNRFNSGIFAFHFVALFCISSD
jgi:hypothetical protein